MNKALQLIQRNYERELILPMLQQGPLQVMVIARQLCPDKPRNHQEVVTRRALRRLCQSGLVSMFSDRARIADKGGRVRLRQSNFVRLTRKGAAHDLYQP